MITDILIQQLRFMKQFYLGNKIQYKNSEGTYTYYKESKTLYFKANNRRYFSEQGQFLGCVSL